LLAGLRSCFRAQVRKAYRQNPYHNFFHCVDVTHVTYRFIALVSHAVALTHAERLALMLAALCHDMEHPGAAPYEKLEVFLKQLCWNLEVN